MAREQVSTGQQTAWLDPQAQPLDTYVKPPQDDGGAGGLLEIAQSLRGFGGDLDAMLSKQEADQKQKDYLAGQEAATLKTAGGQAAGVSQGLIPAQASPMFQRGYQEAQGDVTGNDISARYQNAYDTWAGKDYTGPDAYQKFAAWRSDWLKSQTADLSSSDPYFFKGLKPHLDAITSASTTAFAKDQHDLVYNGAISTAGTQVQQAVDDFNTRGIAAGGQTDYAAAFQRVQAIRSGLISRGVRADDATTMANDAMVAAATKYKDPGYLSWFDQQDPQKPGTTYGQEPTGLAKWDSARKTVDALQRQDAGEKSRAFERQQETDKADIENQAIAALAANPSAPLDPSLMKRAAQNGKLGTFPVQIMQWRKTFLDGLPSDQTGILHIQQDMMADPTNAMGTLTRAVKGGIVANPDDFTKLHTLAKDIGGNADGVKAILDADATKQIDQVIYSRSTGKDITTPGAFGGATNETLAAQNSFHQELSAWAVANPQASLIDRNKAVADIGKRYVDAFTPVPMKPGAYVQPQGAPENAFSGAVQQKAAADQQAREQARFDAQKPALIEQAEAQRPRWWQRGLAGMPGGMSGDELAARDAAVDQTQATIRNARAPTAQGRPTASTSPVDPQAYQDWMRTQPADALAKINAAAQQRAGQYGGDPEAARQDIFRQVQARKTQGQPPAAAPAQGSTPPSVPPGRQGALVIDRNTLDHPAVRAVAEAVANHPDAPGVASRVLAAINPVSSAQAAEASPPAPPAAAGPTIQAGSGQNLGQGKYGAINAAYRGDPDKPGEGGIVSPRQFYSYLVSQGASNKEALLLTGAAANESSFNAAARHDPDANGNPQGYGLFGHNKERLAAMRASAGGAQFPDWQQQAAFALKELRSRPEGARVNGAQTPEDLADLEMHFEMPRGYSAGNPRAGDNYNGRLNTIRHFAALTGGPDIGTVDGGPVPGPGRSPSGPKALPGVGTIPAPSLSVPAPAAKDTRMVNIAATGGGTSVLDHEDERVLDAVAERNPNIRFAIVPQQQDDGSMRSQLVALDKRGRLVDDASPEHQTLAGVVAATVKALGAKLNQSSGLKLFLDHSSAPSARS